MIIRRMKACFGVLDGRELNLEPGLNVICAPNEGGKSTWCAFIRAMLYGIDSSQREKNGVKPDKLRYAPWSGAPMSGEMDISFEGRDISLRRSTKSAAAPMREFSAVYTGTAMPVPGLSGTGAGEILTGMSRAVFDRSVFAGPAGLGVDNSPELEKRIAAIVSTGDEGVSYTQADAQLRAWQRRRRHNRSGAIPALDAEIDALEKELKGRSGVLDQMQRLEEQLSQAKERENSCRLRAEEEKRLARRRLADSVAEARRRLDADNERAEELHSRCIDIRARLDRSVFAGMDWETAGKTAEKDVQELEKASAAVPRGGRLALLILAALALGGLAAFLLRGAAAAAIAAGAAPLAALAVFACMRAGKARELEGRMKRRYGGAGAGDIQSLAVEHSELLRELEETETQLEQAQQAAAKSREALTELEDRLLAEPVPGPEEYGWERAREESGALSRRLYQCRGSASAMGDPMVMNGELLELRSRRSELEEEYSAIALALDVLGQANEEMQLRFSPELGRLASAYMSRLTGGRYESLVFDRELRARARLSGGSQDREKAFLSRGTEDQFYLALRLAVCRLALDGSGGSCPLVLDDALINFDDERMGLALELLREIAGERQVILFSCQSREAEYLKRKQ